VVAPSSLQPYDLLRHDRLILSKDTALHLGRTLGKHASGDAQEGSGSSQLVAPPVAPVAGKEKPVAKAKAFPYPRQEATAKPKAAASKAKGKSKDKE
jgi:hypothetical protein